MYDRRAMSLYYFLEFYVEKKLLNPHIGIITPSGGTGKVPVPPRQLAAAMFAGERLTSLSFGLLVYRLLCCDFLFHPPTLLLVLCTW